MVIPKKPTPIILMLIIVLSIIVLSIFLVDNYNQTIEILYFTNPKCIIINKTDDLIEGIKNKFGDRVHVREIMINMYPNDPAEPEETKQLREKYRVYGAPVIIINRKEFTEEFTKDNLERDICRNFIIKPGVCR